MSGVYISEKDTAFIHIPKCAGTSIREWLRSEGSFDIMSLEKRDFDLKHPTLDDIKAHFGRDKFEYTFAVVRNPYDRVVSMWKHLNVKSPLRKEYGIEKRTTLQDFVFKYADYEGFMRPQSTWFSEEDGVDVLRFEDLQNEFRRVQKRFGRKDDLLILNEGKKTESDYRGLEDVKNHVYEKMKEDFERFGYSK